MVVYSTRVIVRWDAYVASDMQLHDADLHTTAPHGLVAQGGSYHWLCERAYYSLALIPYPSAFFSLVLFSPIVAALRSAPDFSTLLLCPTTRTYTTHTYYPVPCLPCRSGMLLSLSLFLVRWLCFFFFLFHHHARSMSFLSMANVPCLFSHGFPFTRQLLLLASSFFPSIPAFTPFAVI